MWTWVEQQWLVCTGEGMPSSQSESAQHLLPLPISPIHTTERDLSTTRVAASKQEGFSKMAFLRGNIWSDRLHLAGRRSLKSGSHLAQETINLQCTFLSANYSITSHVNSQREGYCAFKLACRHRWGSTVLPWRHRGDIISTCS